MEESAAAAESLQEQADNLARVVSVFKLDAGQVAAARPNGETDAEVIPLTAQARSSHIAASVLKRIAKDSADQRYQQRLH